MILVDQKILFIDICKTASCSINNCLGRAFDVLHKKRGFHHSLTNLNMYTHKITPKVTDEYFVFTFVRNPFDRLVSLWSPNRPGHRSGILWAEKFPDFNEFVRAIRAKKRRQAWTFMWLPMCQWLDAEDKPLPECLDFIGRFENLHADFATLCDKIGIEQRTLPHHNRSDHCHYSTYYNDESLEFATEFYARDLELFGYEFEDRR